MNDTYTDTRTVELALLELVGEADGPVGAGTLQHALRDHRIRIGEATVGRLLRRLDQEGWTRRHGKQGRTLTVLGHRKLAQLRREVERRHNSEELAKTLTGSTPKALIDTLIGRRAIERETARLAALRRTEADADRLRAIDARQRDAKIRGLPGTRENRAFHKVIAEIACNPVLESALDLILCEFEVSEALVEVRERVGAKLGVDHAGIIQAILDRDPDAAEAAMVRHIDHIIDDVVHYFEREGHDLPESVTRY